MYNFLLSTHSIIRWMVLLAGIIAIVVPLLNNINSPLQKKDKMPALFFMITCDIQLVIGLWLYVGYSGYGVSAFHEGMSHVMKNADIRKIAIEHFALTMIAFILVHIAYAKIKRATEFRKVRRLSVIYFTSAIVLILAAVPWHRILI
ncbi:MAG: hypothetical protein V4613_13030 [Bacteroidota bacterium]